MSLDKLILGCANKEPVAQEQLYRLFAGKMFALCLKYSKNKEEAEDNLQDGFIQIYDKISQFKNKGSFEGWMKRIVINTALQKYRDKNVLNVVYDFVDEEEVMVEVEEDDISLDYLLKLIQELPNQYRLVFNLYVLDGYSHKEISKELKISEGTSKSNLSRARAILKEKIESRQQESGFLRAFQ
ncbi:MAG: sigma-70 family RNA polymerase sigma factor [Flavobacteriaceae bacterium]|nr:sigma-70 family RNA polymerase sigma factor [Flavobacteriaceae bacterium]